MKQEDFESTTILCASKEFRNTANLKINSNFMVPPLVKVIVIVIVQTLGIWCPSEVLRENTASLANIEHLVPQ